MRGAEMTRGGVGGGIEWNGVVWHGKGCSGVGWDGAERRSTGWDEVGRGGPPRHLIAQSEPLLPSCLRGRRIERVSNPSAPCQATDVRIASVSSRDGGHVDYDPPPPETRLGLGLVEVSGLRLELGLGMGWGLWVGFRYRM